MMIVIDIPGFTKLQLKYMVLDYNGTLAVDGDMLPGVKETLVKLATQLEIHVITADTFGKVEKGMQGIPCQLSIMPVKDQDHGKRVYVQNLGRNHSVCIGNGRNDRLMLKEAVLGIAVILGEGAAAETIQAADVVCNSIISALELLIHPLRLVATLRN